MPRVYRTRFVIAFFCADFPAIILSHAIRSTVSISRPDIFISKSKSSEQPTAIIDLRNDDACLSDRDACTGPSDLLRSWLTSEVVLLADLYADRILAGRNAGRCLFFQAFLPGDYGSSSHDISTRVDLSCRRACRPLVPAAMPESLVIDALPSTAPTKRKRLPGTYRTGPIFGGRTISAMGNRPQDHMDRDLLLASLLRDRRLRMFRKQCVALPDWAPAVPDSIQENFQHRAQELIMLGSHQQHLIERMRETIGLAADRCQGEKMLELRWKPAFREGPSSPEQHPIQAVPAVTPGYAPGAMPAAFSGFIASCSPTRAHPNGWPASI